MSEDWYSRWSRKKLPFARDFMDFDEILREINEVMEKELSKLAKDSPNDLIREQTLPDGTKTRRLGPFVYGYSVTISPDGKPQIREFGNFKAETKSGRPTIGVSEKREPLIDVIETDSELRVVAELPGVEKEDIKLFGTENSLTISVDSPQRKYHKEIELPVNVEQNQAKSTYKNGVLEVVLKIKEEEKPKGFSINVE